MNGKSYPFPCVVFFKNEPGNKCAYPNAIDICLVAAYVPVRSTSVPMYLPASPVVSLTTAFPFAAYSASFALASHNQ